ncbi:MAG: exodeoxyribonuclease VII small subunit [Deltaproteobacteria bacterium]|nr:exodeoxyribonuclease VII small subunit [Deltaproteobacteria bacterium]
MTDDKNRSFEEMMARLDDIAGRLESGESSLEESIALFEEGMQLAKTGMERLDDAERRVRILVDAADGEREEDFDSP